MYSTLQNSITLPNKSHVLVYIFLLLGCESNSRYSPAETTQDIGQDEDITNNNPSTDDIDTSTNNSDIEFEDITTDLAPSCEESTGEWSECLYSTQCSNTGIKSRTITSCENGIPASTNHEETCTRETRGKIITEGERSVCLWDASCHTYPARIKTDIICFQEQETRTTDRERCSTSDIEVANESCVARGFVDHSDSSSGSLTRATSWQLFETRIYEYQNQQPDTSNTSHHPQTNITWFHAIAFCNQKSQSIGAKPCYEYEGQHYNQEHANQYLLPQWPEGLDCKGYRLPTETEWLRVYNTDENASMSTEEQVIDTRELMPMRHGLYGLYNNAYEWGWDWYSPAHVPNVEDFTGPPNGEQRLILGLRPNGHKAGLSPTLTNNLVGFRCIRTASERYINP